MTFTPHFSHLRFIVLAFICSLGLQAQDLESLINEAITSNPELQKHELNFAIATEQVNEVDQMPDTQFGIGYFVSEPETRTGPQNFKVSVNQMLPWFGEITARENYKTALADAQYQDVVIAKRQLIVAVSQAYYNLYANLAQQNLLQKNLSLVNQYIDLALNSVEVGQASAVEVLRLQMRQNSLEEQHQLLQNAYKSELARLNALRNRAPSTPVLIETELLLPKIDEASQAEQLSVHPELIKYDRLFQSVEKSELINQKLSQPKLGVGLNYINVSKRPEMMFEDNGKDIIMPMLSLSIPLFTKAYHSKTRQNELAKQQLIVQKKSRLNTLKTALNEAINQRYSARVSYNTQKKNLLQAQQAREIILKTYENSQLDFTELLDLQDLELEFETAKVEAIEAYFLASTRINYLTN